MKNSVKNTLLFKRRWKQPSANALPVVLLIVFLLGIGVPLVIFLFLVLKIVLRENIPEAGIVLYGLTLAVLGMIIFNVGLSYGLAKLGGLSGSFVPAAFTKLENIKESPLYGFAVGVSVEVEKKVINIVVSNELVERVFEKMCLAGSLDTPGMGIMYITPLEKAATYIPPEVLEKLAASQGSEG